MSEKEMQFHYHHFGITKDDFYKSKIHEHFQVLSYDECDSQHYITSIEAYSYPIYGVLFHPEYQWLQYKGDKVLN